MKESLESKLYFILFNAITSAINELEQLPITAPYTVTKALAILKNAQQTTEELYISADDD